MKQRQLLHELESWRPSNELKKKCQYKKYHIVCVVYNEAKANNKHNFYVVLP